MDIVSEEKITQCYVELRLHLNEGELIPLPDRVIRVASSPNDMYQILKMNANPNLAHKVNFTLTGNGTKKAGANTTDMFMIFFDDVSLSETRKLLDYYNIAYTVGPELGSEMGRQVNKPPFRSKMNPPTDADDLYGQYYHKDDNPL